MALQKRRHRKIYAAKALMHGWTAPLKPNVGSHRRGPIAHLRVHVWRHLRWRGGRAVVHVTAARKMQFGMDVFTGIPCHVRAACKRQLHTMRSKGRARHDIRRRASFIGVHGDPRYDGLTALRRRDGQQIADGEVRGAAIGGRLLQKLNANEVVPHINIPSRRWSGRAEKRPRSGIFDTRCYKRCVLGATTELGVHRSVQKRRIVAIAWADLGVAYVRHGADDGESERAKQYAGR